jgi:glycerate 2-kinase
MGMLHFAALVKQQFGVDLNAIKGGGAAGGMGAGCVFFLDATIRSGVELLLHYSHAEKHFEAATIVITGEGKLDSQSLQGKVVRGVATLAKKYNKPVIALCGTCDVAMDLLQTAGVTASFSIVPKPMLLEDAMENAERLLVQTAYSLGKVLIMTLK